MFAIELQAEATTIAQTQEEWITVGGLLTSLLNTIAHGVLQAMATLHQGTIATFDFESRGFLDTIEIGSKAVGDVIEVRMGILRTGIMGSGCLI